MLRHADRSRRFLNDPIGFVGRRFDLYGDTYFAPSPDGDLYVFRHPDHIEEILISNASSFDKKHTGFRRLAELMGDGLLNSEGDTWRRHRRLIQPVFHPTRLDDYAQVMVEEAEGVVRRWQRLDSIDVASEMSRLTLLVVSRTLFSHDASSDSDSVRSALMALLDSFSTPTNLLPRWIPTPGQRRLRDAVNYFDSFVYELIRRRRRGGSQGGDSRDLLQALLTATDDDGSGLSDVEIRDQLVTFFIAGHETTAQALTWTWYLLSQNLGVESRMHAEISAILDNRLPSYADAADLEYTERVVLEAMRLYPPAFVIPRRAAMDTRVGDWEIPAGAEVAIWTLFTHRDPRWYPKPMRFDPERFTTAAKAARPRCAYLPFGFGSRTCIGKSFATLEATLLLATLAQHFKLRLEPGHRVSPRPRLTLAPRGGLPMRIARR